MCKHLLDVCKFPIAELCSAPLPSQPASSGQMHKHRLYLKSYSEQLVVSPGDYTNL